MATPKFAPPIVTAFQYLRKFDKRLLDLRQTQPRTHARSTCWYVSLFLARTLRTCRTHLAREQQASGGVSVRQKPRQGGNPEDWPKMCCFQYFAEVFYDALLMISMTTMRQKTALASPSTRWLRRSATAAGYGRWIFSRSSYCGTCYAQQVAGMDIAFRDSSGLT